VHNFGTCRNNTATQCQLLIQKTCLAAKFVGSRHCAAAFFWPVLKSCTGLDQTLLYILILGTYTKFVWYLAFASRSPSRALAAGLPHHDHVCSTTDESFCSDNKYFGKMRCKLDSTGNPRSFEENPTPP